jgi:hypothetical protein
LKAIEKESSIRIRYPYGSADPDPDLNVMDPEHCILHKCSVREKLIQSSFRIWIPSHCPERIF